MTDEELDARITEIETKTDAVFAANGDTRSLYELGPNQWEPARARMHKQLIDELYATFTKVPTDRKAVLAGGLGGAGKSTVLNEHAGFDTGQYITINPDDFKEIMARKGMIPQVEGLSPMEASGLAHWEAGYLADLLADRALADGKNVIFDGTMSWKEAVEATRATLKDAGYTDVHGVFVQIEPSEAFRRAQFRLRTGTDAWRRGEGHGGRHVKKKFIMDNVDPITGTKNRRTFDATRAGLVTWQIWDNNVFGRKPVLIDHSGKPKKASR